MKKIIIFFIINLILFSFINLKISIAEEPLLNEVLSTVDINARVQLFNYGPDINSDPNTMIYQYIVKSHGSSIGSGKFGFESGVAAKDNANSSSATGYVDISLAPTDLKGSYSPTYIDSDIPTAFYPQARLGADGYPKIAGIPMPGHEGLVDMNFGTTDSFAYLFSDIYAVSPVMENGGGLFQLTEEGYYEYDSAKNSVYYDSTKEKFIVYDTPISPHYIEEYYTNLANKQYGNFLPFNNPITSIGSEYKEVNGIKYYKMDGTKVENWPDMWFGMTVDFDFYMPKDGRWNGKDMVFQFDGDDDVMVFIDDVLVLDISGIHDPEYASLDFVTGEINDERTKYLYGGTPTTLKQRFLEAGKTENEIAELFEGDTFKDYTEHTLKFFYLERGSGFSYCHLKFNLPTLICPITIKNDVQNNTGYEDDIFIYKIILKDENGNALTNVEYVDSTGNVGILELDDGQTTFQLKDDEYYTFNIPLNSSYEIFKSVENDEYTSTWQGTMKGTVTETTPIDLINVNIRNELKDITVIKKWEDNANQYNERPSSVFVELLQNNVVIDEVELNSSNEWKHIFENLNIYDESKKEYIYSVREKKIIEGYFVKEIKEVDNVFTITNTKYGIIKINKEDLLTGEKLEGAVFKLEKNNNSQWETIGEYSTDSSGIIVINNLTYGTYRLKEIQAPEGYSFNLENAEVELEISEFNLEYELTVSNKAKTILPAAGGGRTQVIIVIIMLLLLLKKIIIRKK